MTRPPDQIFLLSPAYCGGRRASLLLRPGAGSPLAARLHDQTLTLGEAFSFLSGLYFRGKLAYALAFGRTTVAHAGSTLIITPTRGLLAPETLVSAALLREFASVDVSAADARYRAPLERDVATLAGGLSTGSRIILLGSVATGKYVDVLVGLLGATLHYPPSFIGRGDMSRGGLLLRSARSGAELEYAALDPAVKRRGPRPPRLEPLSPGGRGFSPGG
jgi:hypothetical protein